jgi:hypothetical protein
MKRKQAGKKRYYIEKVSPPCVAQKKSEDFTRKIEPLRGGLVREMIRCGRPNCKCANGSLHGPYYYRVWMVQGVRYKSYVKKADFDRIRAGIRAFRAQWRDQQKADAEFRAMLREIREASRNIYSILRLRGFKL